MKLDILCPNCGSRNDLKTEDKQDQRLISCTTCTASFVIKWKIAFEVQYSELNFKDIIKGGDVTGPTHLSDTVSATYEE
jgi:DNA-directed RNA polymerase subunit RPC12/RpoP